MVLHISSLHVMSSLLPPTSSALAWDTMQESDVRWICRVEQLLQGLFAVAGSSSRRMPLGQ